MGYCPPGGLVSPFGGFASLFFDQPVGKNSQRHLADQNAICTCIDQIVPGFVVYHLNNLNFVKKTLCETNILMQLEN